VKIKEFVRVVGDTHGLIYDYMDLVKDIPYSVQLGDMGFNYEKLNALDSDKHRFIGGNHDNYHNLPPHVLGDYGTHNLGGLEFFYVRGAKSIDWKYRTLGVDMWAEEEIGLHEYDNLEKEWLKAKPSLVLTHTCPTSLISQISSITHWDGELLIPDITSQMLDTLFRKHQPKAWYFGHFHRSKQVVVDGCRFRCLAELEYVDLDFEGNEL